MATRKDIKIGMLVRPLPYDPSNDPLKDFGFKLINRVGIVIEIDRKKKYPIMVKFNDVMTEVFVPKELAVLTEEEAVLYRLRIGD